MKFPQTLRQLQTPLVLMALSFPLYWFFGDFVWDEQSQLAELRTALLILGLITGAALVGALFGRIPVPAIAWGFLLSSTFAVGVSLVLVIRNYDKPVWLDYKLFHYEVKPSWLSYARENPHAKIRSNLSRFIFLGEFLAHRTLTVSTTSNLDSSTNSILSTTFLEPIAKVSSLHRQDFDSSPTESEFQVLSGFPHQHTFQPTDREKKPVGKALRVVLAQKLPLIDNFYLLESENELIFVDSQIFQSLRGRNSESGKDS